ncbi:MAG TPA: YetF domain-containing protein [Thermoanaerobaculia bacterium]
MQSILGNWSDAARSAISGLLAYTALVVLVRISGKRTVAKWNAFDLIVTVALGSTLASTIVTGTVPVLQGAGAFIVLVGLQFAITWASVRVKWIHRLVKAQPALLVRDGRFEHETMRRERVTEDEVLTAARRGGVGDLREVQAIVLETDGSFSVIGSVADDVAYSTLRGVHGAAGMPAR